MNIEFYKYQGTGNDFVLIDNRSMALPNADQPLVARLCDRKFGIGADGLMLLQNKAGYDFEMVYFNADGNPSSMCGNGGRCITAFAQKLGVIEADATFLAVDGPHEASVQGDIVRLKMQDVSSIEQLDNGWFLDTGSPHVVQFVDAVSELDVVQEGRAIRNNDRFQAEGTNVNFVEAAPNNIKVRTYERGVEDETLSCGTGVTACVLASFLAGINNEANHCLIETPGGQLTVSFEQHEEGFRNIWLEGPATFVFHGSIAL